jgi:hypothetical protein
MGTAPGIEDRVASGPASGQVEETAGMRQQRRNAEDVGPGRTALRAVLGLAAALVLALPAGAQPAVPFTWQVETRGGSLTAVPPLPPLDQFPLQLVLDDDSFEATFGVTGASGARQFLWFNQFVAGVDFPQGNPLQLEEIWVLFPTGPAITAGAAIQLVVYEDADGDPANGAVRVFEMDDTIQVADDNTFSIYPLTAPLELSGDNDVLLGVIPRFIVSGVTPVTTPAAQDTTTSAGQSWVAIWMADPPDPPDMITPGSDPLILNMDTLSPGNFLVRGFGSFNAVFDPTVPTISPTGGALLVLLLAGLGALLLRRRRAGAGAALLLGLLALAPAARAIDIDTFATLQGPQSDPPGGATSVVTGGSDILGQRRDLAVRLTSGPGPATTEVSGGALSFAVADTTPDSTGQVVVTWDGDADPNLLSPTGLGGVDLTDGGAATGFRLAVSGATAGAQLVIEVYTDAGHASRVGRVLPAIAAATDVVIDFSALRPIPGLAGGADVTDVGAVLLRVLGREAQVEIEEVDTTGPALDAFKGDFDGSGVAIVAPVRPGDPIRYRITIQNPGAGASGIDLSDVLDANVGLVAGSIRTTPLARDDQYQTVTNAPLDSAGAGLPPLLANDGDPDGNAVAAVPVTGQPTSQGGSVDVLADGHFVYTPPVDFNGVDAFLYTLAAVAGDPTADAQGSPIGPIQATAAVFIDRVPPVVTAGGTLAYTENDPPTAIDTTLTVTDADSPMLASATAQVTGNYVNGEDVLSFIDTPNITGVFVPATGALTLTGTDTVANYQAALRAVRYENTSDDPSTLARTVTWTASDGDASSVPVTSTITVAAVNDPPVLTAGGTLTYTENDPPTAIDTTLTVTDADSANLTQATAQITANYVVGQDLLSFVNTPNITGVFVPATGTLTLTGTDTVANYQAALRAVRYENTSDNPSTLPRTVTWIASDGADPSALVTSTINVIAVNDPPVLTNDPIAYSTVGNTQLHVAGATLAGVASIADAVGALAKAAPTDVDGPGPLPVVPVSGATANGQIDLNADGSFTYVPNPGFTGIDSFVYQVTDSHSPPGLVSGTIHITVSEVVWYVRDVVDANNPAGGDGRSTDAFESLAAVEAASGAGHRIFVFRGNTGAGPLDGGITLKNGQKLHGEGVGLTVPGFGTLVPAGTRPHITHTTAGGNGVTVLADTVNGDRTGIEIRGLEISGSANAIDVTSANAAQLGVSISDNAVSGAGAEGIDVNLGSTSGSQTLALHDNTVTAASTGIDITRTAGTLTITAFGDNTVSGASGAGILVFGPNVVFDAVPGGGFDTVAGGALTIGTAGDPVGGTAFHLESVSGDLAYDSVNVFGGGNGLGVVGTGGFNGAAGMRFRHLNPGTGVVQAGTGNAVALTNLTADLRLATLSSTGSSGIGVLLSSVVDGTGTNAMFSAGAGSSITNASGVAFQIVGGNATINYAGTITNSSNRSVQIENRTADTAIFTGQISDTGAGILLSNNGASVTTFAGGLELSTGSNPAFTATGGGTVEVCDENPCNPGATGGLVNTLTTTTATALNVANTTISANNLEFRSISAGTAASGPTNGIVLNNTGALGGLKVKGTGASAQGGDASGGLIRNTTGHGISLTSTRAPSFTNMTVQTTGGSGINGTQVTDFTFDNGTITGSGDAVGESNIAFNGNGTLVGNNLSGVVTITDSVLNTAFDSGVHLQSNGGTISNATLSNNSLTSTTSTATSKGCAIKVVGTGTATTVANVMRATIANNVIANFPSACGIQVIGGNVNATGPAGFVGNPSSGTDVISIAGNSISGQSAANRLGTSAIEVSTNGGNSAQRSQGNFDVSNNNPLTNMAGTAILVGHNGYVDGTYVTSGNVIVANNTVASQGIGGGNGIVASSSETPHMTWTITNNNISQTDGNGILAVSRGVTGTLNVGIRNNSVAAPLTGVRPGIRVDAGNSSSVDDAVCAEIANNTSGGSGGHAGIGIRKQGTNATINDFGIEGLSPSPALCGQAEDHVSAQNPGAVALGTDCDGNPGSKTLAISGSNFVSCNTAP